MKTSNNAPWKRIVWFSHNKFSLFHHLANFQKIVLCAQSVLGAVGDVQKPIRVLGPQIFYFTRKWKMYDMMSEIMQNIAIMIKYKLFCITLLFFNFSKNNTVRRLQTSKLRPWGLRELCLNTKIENTKRVKKWNGWLKSLFQFRSPLPLSPSDCLNQNMFLLLRKQTISTSAICVFSLTKTSFLPMKSCVLIFLRPVRRSKLCFFDIFKKRKK